MQQIDNLEHQLLVAMPSLNESYFERAVIYVLEHTKEGAMGVTINIPANITYKDMFDYLQIECNTDEAEEMAVLRGGPVDSERCFVFQQTQLSTQNVPGQMYISDDQQALETLAQQEHMDNALIILGYSGWTPGQLEDELARNDWLIAPPSQRLLFETPYQDRWSAAASQVGVDVTRLSGEVGHG